MNLVPPPASQATKPPLPKCQPAPEKQWHQTQEAVRHQTQEDMTSMGIQREEAGAYSTVNSPVSSQALRIRVTWNANRRSCSYPYQTGQDSSTQTTFASRLDGVGEAPAQALQARAVWKRGPWEVCQSAESCTLHPNKHGKWPLGRLNSSIVSGCIPLSWLFQKGII